MIFLRDHAQKGDIVLEFVDMKNKLADIFTKSLALDRFSHIQIGLAIIDESELHD